MFEDRNGIAGGILVILLSWGIEKEGEHKI